MFDDDDNTFRAECRRFEWDARILIDRGLHAALETLRQQLNREFEQISEWSRKPGVMPAEVATERADAVAQMEEQAAFLGNSALVMLVSRLDLALRRMARLGDSLASWKLGKYSGRFPVGGFGRLWNEYEARFGFDFIADAREIDFVEPMVLARNLIIHQGAQAVFENPDGSLNKGFAESHPQYVVHSSVCVSQELLEENINRSVFLLEWVANRLRELEVGDPDEWPSSYKPLTTG
jgi:hypothetical protein